MAAVTTAGTPIVDWSLLGQVVVVSIVIGVGLVVAFSLGLASLSLARGTQRTSTRFTSGFVALVLAAGIAWAVVWGLEVIIKK